MYMNACQKYIYDLILEYGSLLKRQLLTMINFKFNTRLSNINGYIAQMCIYSDITVLNDNNDEIVLRKETEPDYDMIRSFDIMLAFMPKIEYPRKSRSFVSITFYINSGTSIKKVAVIPVKESMEKVIASFAEDKFGDEKKDVVIFLLDSRKQLRLVRSECNHKFAIIDKKGVSFLKENI